MFKKIILFFLVFKNTTCFSQNLVLNGDFEDFSSCPTSSSETNLLYNIQNPNTATPDFFTTCCINQADCGVPTNFAGTQNALSLNSYCGFGFLYPSIAEYLTLKLSETLSMGYYEVRFYVSLGDNWKYAVSKIGVYFHSNIINTGNSGYLNYIPQIINPDSNFITDKNNWTLISGIYQASGGEQYITIGNFNSSDSTDTLATNNLPSNSTTNIAASYYYIDAVSVVEIKDTTINNTLLFPSPNNGSFTLNYNLENEKQGVFEIYNELGQIIFQQALTQNNGTTNFELNFAPGMYFWVLTTPAKKLATNKFIIQK